MKKQLRWKFLREGMKSDNGNIVWKMNRWVHHDGKLDMCHTGLHCSLYPDQAFQYVSGEILAQVEIKGQSIIQNDKECWSDMKIVKVWKWQKKDSVALAIYAAEQVIDIYEKEYPNDDRPRKAIEAAKAYLKDPTQKNMVAAGEAARAAGEAARAAGEAARAAGWAAGEAARAAGEAARAAIVKNIRSWMLRRIKKLEKI
ncbi:MAG: putative immunity protein [Patescibacteria group bacterium]